jgi:hypothetical protein
MARRGRKRRLDVKRRKDGKVSNAEYQVRDKGTPELQAKRKAGERDEVVDALHAGKLITDQQLEAFRVYERARRIYIGSVSPKTATLAEMIHGGKGELSDRAILSARQAFLTGQESLQRCGSRSAFPQVQDLICNEKPYDIQGLRIGLDALVALYRMGEGKAA